MLRDMMLRQLRLHESPYSVVLKESFPKLSKFGSIAIRGTAIAAHLRRESCEPEI